LFFFQQKNSLGLGIVTDADILNYICYDIDDTEMVELLRPSFEEAQPIQTQEIALDYIGKRGSTVGATSDKRIRFANDILQKEMFPHVGVGQFSGKKKAHFLGYMVFLLFPFFFFSFFSFFFSFLFFFSACFF